MRLETSFEVGAPVEAAWRLLNDVPAVVPCMPGAELLEAAGDDAWKARLEVRLGPIALEFLTDVTRQAADEASGRIVLAARAREARGRGHAQATIESVVTGGPDRTHVDIATELTLQGQVAQYGRGVVADVANRLTTEFAACLARQLAMD